MIKRTYHGHPPVMFTTKQTNKNLPKTQKSWTMQNSSSANCLKFSFTSLSFLLFHCLFFSSFSFLQLQKNSCWCLCEYSSTLDTSCQKRSVATAEKVKEYNCKSMFFIQNRLILLFTP